ncbi:hypothetical protein K501DRAFT_277072 [Backusella circina FSU 941]|nr:hypothetical protein K501DRAFT_277072 [Backusella circina FSU 941]
MVSITLVSIGREYMGTRIPSHEVATSEKGLPHSRVSITPVAIGREYMGTQMLLLQVICNDLYPYHRHILQCAMDDFEKKNTQLQISRSDLYHVQIGKDAENIAFKKLLYL